jgi:hypothetical protein
MRLATLYYNPETDNTKISVSGDFEELDSLMRLDALKDCIGLFEEEYKKTLIKWSKEYANR